MRLILSIPLFAYLLVAANMVLLSGDGSGPMMNVIVFELALPSDRDLLLTVSDALIISSVLCLYLEAFKATRTSVISILDHTFSLLVFVIFLIEFLVFAPAGNATFLIITICALVDVVMGFTITISTARRDVTFGG